MNRQPAGSPATPPNPLPAGPPMSRLKALGLVLVEILTYLAPSAILYALSRLF